MIDKLRDELIGAWETLLLHRETPERQQARRNLSRCRIGFVSLSKGSYASSFGLASVGTLSLCCAALEVGALLNHERFVSNITDHMRLGLKHNVTTLNWTLHSTVHNHPLSNDTANDLSI
jgi:hypothetical protein